MQPPVPDDGAAGRYPRRDRAGARRVQALLVDNPQRFIVCAGAQTHRNKVMSGRLQDRIAIDHRRRLRRPRLGQRPRHLRAFRRGRRQNFCCRSRPRQRRRNRRTREGSRRRDRRASMRRHRRRLSRSHGQGLPRSLRPHRYSGQQCRRLRPWRPGRIERGRLGRPGRHQPQERFSRRCKTCCR